ncbi:aminopeptidase N [Sphingomonas flavalba]|uniref:aminopeptidase N n=1 Tax=Sphingomonas flavalba TaxID=2559804 RepID=UPI00109DA16E|nr:aminopeptidase N [Sphingomonas flavalba]
MSDAPSLSSAPHVIRREDYRPPEWLVPEIALDFDLDPALTRVKAVLSVRRNAGDGPLRLDGGGQQPVAVRVDGAKAEWWMEGEQLVIPLAGEAHSVETEVEIAPETNTQLMGLYASGGLLCTQCEAEGFRRITFFPDRPDILSRYQVKLTADHGQFPVLLSNGDRIGSGTMPGGRHWAEWHDPFPKPCYLFALVAGDLAVNRDSFTTMGGRVVELGIWVAEADLPRTDHAMAALKAAMAWDERVYGREYDLDMFNIVAVADFNFGAMENKGLNIFNSRYILADPETATDADFDAIAGVVAHEYFHNWSGDRVTCRDWFQLSLKEGFTVYRDQSFSADMGSAAVKRIEDVRVLRAAQFPEDAGPLAHPVRPESYMEIANFYTATVYNKGAELIRMMATMLGPQRFRAATDLYFARHDGTAATCEDFVVAMEEGGGIDFGRFRRWYTQAGTPRVAASLTHAPASGKAVLHLTQAVPPTPGQPDKLPQPLPLRVALFGEASGARLCDERLVVLDEAEAEVVFDGIGERPLLSINRGFSAPVIVDANRSAAELAFLSAHDDDPFARYEAMQQLMLDRLVATVTGGDGDPAPVVAAVRATVADPTLDPAFVGEAIVLPSEAFIGDQLASVDPDAVARARDGLRQAILDGIGHGAWRALWAANRDNRYDLDPRAKGRRRLKNVALGYLLADEAPDAVALAADQYRYADNMTDRLAALQLLASTRGATRDAVLADFHDRWADNGLVLDKWFTAQALSTRADVVDLVEALARHPAFTLANPNRARALIGAFATNQRGFHAADGRGYRFVAEMLIALDRLNPQTAARLVPPLGRWRRFEPGRALLMKAQLEHILAAPRLSKDVYEQASKSLG